MSRLRLLYVLNEQRGQVAECDGAGLHHVAAKDDDRHLGPVIGRPAIEVLEQAIRPNLASVGRNMASRSVLQAGGWGKVNRLTSRSGRSCRPYYRAFWFPEDGSGNRGGDGSQESNQIQKF